MYSDNFNTVKGIQRIETDYSMALISACIEAMGFRDTAEYLKTAWNCLETNTKIVYAHHICRAHAIRFIEDNTAKHFNKREDSLQLFKNWMHQFLAGIRLEDFYHSVKSAMLICGNRYLTQDVEDALAIVKKSCEPVEEECLWSFMKEVPNERGTPLYLLSPFGSLALQLCKKMHIKIPSELKSAHNWSFSEGTSDESAEETSSTEIKNPHYNPGFLLYLLRYIFPYGCLLNHSLIVLIGAQISEDTNAASESWNAVGIFVGL